MCESLCSHFSAVLHFGVLALFPFAVGVALATAVLSLAAVKLVPAAGPFAADALLVEPASADAAATGTASSDDNPVHFATSGAQNTSATTSSSASTAAFLGLAVISRRSRRINLLLLATGVFPGP